MHKVSWAAFFSDVEHEVLPVTDGYVSLYVNLLYNLYCVDNTVYMAGISLDLPVLVKPVTSDVEVYFKGEKYWDSEYCHYVLPKFSMFIDGGSVDHSDEAEDDEFFRRMFQGALKDTKITWCQELPNFEAAATHIVYGNEASGEIVYQAAAILMCVPKWGKRYTSVVEPQQCSCREQLLLVLTNSLVK